MLLLMCAPFPINIRYNLELVFGKSGSIVRRIPTFLLHSLQMLQQFIKAQAIWYTSCFAVNYGGGAGSPTYYLIPAQGMGQQIHLIGSPIITSVCIRLCRNNCCLGGKRHQAPDPVVKRYYYHYEVSIGQPSGTQLLLVVKWWVDGRIVMS